MIATSETIVWKKESHSNPLEANRSAKLILSKPPWTPTINGVPTAPKETGGPKGLEPTRYGDWEKAGRCSDF